MEDTKKLNDSELAQVSGGKEDKDDYIYQTTPNCDTVCYKAISMTPMNYKTWCMVGPRTSIRVREEGCVDFQGQVYVRCLVNIGEVVEGYILQSCINRKNV